jgi:hypothetical protein
VEYGVPAGIGAGECGQGNIGHDNQDIVIRRMVNRHVVMAIY